MKLSGKQQYVLNLMREGHRAYQVTGMDHYWYLDTNPIYKCSLQIPALLNAGLIEIVKRDWRGDQAMAKQVAP